MRARAAAQSSSTYHMYTRPLNLANRDASGVDVGKVDLGRNSTPALLAMVNSGVASQVQP
jgi:hypothetical protein